MKLDIYEDSSLANGAAIKLEEYNVLVPTGNAMDKVFFIGTVLLLLLLLLSFS
jgi:hypothetical protein